MQVNGQAVRQGMKVVGSIIVLHKLVIRPLVSLLWGDKVSAEWRPSRSADKPTPRPAWLKL